MAFVTGYYFDIYHHNFFIYSKILNQNKSSTVYLFFNMKVQSPLFLSFDIAIFAAVNVGNKRIVDIVIFSPCLWNYLYIQVQDSIFHCFLIL